MIEIKALVYTLLQAILIHIIHSTLSRNSNADKIPEDIRNKLNSNQYNLTNIDREALFDSLKIKPINNKAICHIIKKSESPTQHIVWFSRLQTKYVLFNDNEIIFSNNLICDSSRKFQKKLFEILYYIISFISITPYFHYLFFNENFFNNELIIKILLIITGIFIAIRCANHSIKIDIAEDLVKLGNKSNENHTNDLIPA